MKAFEERAAYTGDTLGKLKDAVAGALEPDTERVLRDTCIYVVGSGGRGEMSPQSDVDLFVARVKGDPSPVDAFQVRQAIARAVFALGLPDPSQGGEFLKMHTAESLCGRMGTPDDDASNTFTARMLLLLESAPLLGDDAYAKLIDTVLVEYWKDAEGHEGDYQPYVLVNDIVRYWRILLLNYVAKNAEKQRKLKEPKLDAERRLRSYKLRFSRCATCFSFLARLLVETRSGPVKREHVLEIVRERPRQRLDRVATVVPEAAACVAELLGMYAVFLENTAAEKDALLQSFQDEGQRSARTGEGWKFGNSMFELVQQLGSKSRARELFRHIVV